jgi:hypothetical protein
MRDIETRAGRRHLPTVDRSDDLHAESLKDVDHLVVIDLHTQQPLDTIATQRDPAAPGRCESDAASVIGAARPPTISSISWVARSIAMRL